MINNDVDIKDPDWHKPLFYLYSPTGAILSHLSVDSHTAWSKQVFYFVTRHELKRVTNASINYSDSPSPSPEPHLKKKRKQVACLSSPIIISESEDDMQNIISDDSSKGCPTKRPCVQASTHSVSNRSSPIAALLNNFHLTNTDDAGNKASPMQLTFNLPSMTA
ncbi:hypothetical protein QCA50_007974 [Cerrena zonata]|uniref:Uncharacterized protein n=1 Tax=Cerrena zonata TaxID=2478898 RepID=A0AAW0G6L1_9APHY